MQHQLEQLETDSGIEWQEYVIGDLFESSNGDFDIQKTHINGIGDYVITAGITENGILGKSDIKAKIFNAQTITIDMFGFAFYRQFQYKLVTHARVFSLKPSFKISENQGLFLVSLLCFLKKKFGYDNMCSWAKIKSETIQLPTSNGNIAFEFMEQFIATLQAERLATLQAYLKTTGLIDTVLTEKEQAALDGLQTVQWEAFKIGDLFDVYTGRDVIIGSVKDGNIPLISHQHSNNGISKKITQLSNRRLFNYKSTLPLADRGVFLATAQNEKFHIGTRVKALIFKDGEKSIQTRNFMVSSINALQPLFLDYSSNATDNLPNLTIQLPITANNIPDYAFMELLITAMQKVVIKNVVDYLDTRIDTTAGVIG